MHCLVQPRKSGKGKPLQQLDLFGKPVTASKGKASRKSKGASRGSGASSAAAQKRESASETGSTFTQQLDEIIGEGEDGVEQAAVTPQRGEGTDQESSESEPGQEDADELIDGGADDRTGDGAGDGGADDRTDDGAGNGAGDGAGDSKKDQNPDSANGAVVMGSPGQASGSQVRVVHPGDLFQLPSDDPVCSKCALPVDPCAPGTRLTKKKPCKFSCGRCCSKSVMLTRMFGSWPLPEFRDLTADELQQFFRSTDNEAKSLRQAVEQLLTRSYTERSSSEMSGTYLPLSVWEKQGYDPVRIQQSAPSAQHPVLGTVYKVDLQTDSRSKIRDFVQQAMARTQRRPRYGGTSSSADAIAAEPANPRAKEEVVSNSSTDEDSSASSSSSRGKKRKGGKKGKKEKREGKGKNSKRKRQRSSSSSDKGKAGRKGKKEKKERKGKKGKKERKDSSSSSSSGGKRARAKSEREEAARIAKEKRKVVVDAAKILAKLGPVGLKLSDVLGRSRISEIPKGIVSRAQKALQDVRALETLAKQQTLNPTCESGLSLDEATSVAKMATEVTGCCLKLLTAVEAL